MDYFKRNKIKLATTIGVVLLLICLTVDTIQTISPSIHRAKDMLESRLHQSEKDAIAVVNNPGLHKAKDDYNLIQKNIKEINYDQRTLFYVYKDGTLKYWSDNSFVPENIDKLSSHDINFLKEGNGFYEVIHDTLKDNHFSYYAFIPVYYQYTINNKFLANGFVWNHPFLKHFIISNKEAKKTIEITDYKKNYLFSIRISDALHDIYNPYIMFFELLGLLLLFWSVYQIVSTALCNKKYTIGIMWIAMVDILIEILFNQLKLFSLTKSSLLFSSNLYASTYWSDTLGGLFIRVFLVMWTTSFIRYLPLKNYSDKIKITLFSVPVILYFLLVFIIQSVIQNSVISFNFYVVNTLDIYTLISLIIFGMGFSSLLFFMKWLSLFPLKNKYVVPIVFYVILGTIIGFLIKSFSDFWYALFIALWFFTFVLFFYFEKSFFQTNNKYKFISNLILLSCISFLTSFIIIYNTQKKDTEKRKYRMQELVSERDIGEEYTLTEQEKLIFDDNFIKSFFKEPYLSTVDINKRITSKYYKLLLRRYDINTYTFSKDGIPLMGLSQKEFNKLDNIRFSHKAKPISDQFYYLSTKENGEKYLGYFPIADDSTQILGCLFIELTPKIFSSYSAYPELLMRQRNYYDDEFDNFSYAIYDNKYLVKQKGDYEYPLTFSFPVKKYKQFTVNNSNGYNHTIYYSKDKQVVLSDKNRPALSTVAIFSYMLIFFLLFFILIDFLGLSDRFWGEESVRDFFKGNTLQKQIQNSMMLLVLFSLVVIALVTMVYFQYQYNIYHNSKLLKKVNTVMKNVTQYYVDDYGTDGSNTFDKVIQQKIKTLSNIHSLDINVYNAKGELLQTSQPEIFKRNLVSTYMDADAYYNLIVKGKSKYVHDEQIGELKYLSAYQPFRSNGKVLGYFDFPYYGKQKNFREDISYFLVALVNVYVLFLLAAALLAIILSRSITNSLTLIAYNIKEVQLGKTNKKILWKNDDEIGLLVSQYNHMIEELEKSADILAKSEREGAWREMAKQVAHEIKNPLTPMKLSIQHLQRALKDNAPDLNELTQKISQRLIEQIDNLSGIATAFSDFAKMPQGEFTKIDMEPILLSTVDLFREIENIKINVEYPSHPCIVRGDKDQLMRVFTNIIKNAVQAVEDSEYGLIDILIQDLDTKYIISIKDNGVGIPLEKRLHIFEPNFTTKTSGTGLGLAISKNIIERMNGTIAFDSEEGKFTIFYLSLPKYTV